MATTLPRTTDAVRDFESLLGSQRVFTSDEDLQAWRDPFQFATWDDYTASAVVLPETVGEVQEVVRIAGRHRVPLWTHSTGRNNGYGGPAPRVKGSVIVSLRRMNRVLEIDEDLVDGRALGIDDRGLRRVRAQRSRNADAIHDDTGDAYSSE